MDFNFLGDELGTQTAPFNTLAEGVSFIAPGGLVNFVPGSTPETANLSIAMTLINAGTGARGGTPEVVRIGDLSARSIGSRDAGPARVGFISSGAKAESVPRASDK